MMRREPKIHFWRSWPAKIGGDGALGNQLHFVVKTDINVNDLKWKMLQKFL